MNTRPFIIIVLGVMTLAVITMFVMKVTDSDAPNKVSEIHLGVESGGKRVSRVPHIPKQGDVRRKASWKKGDYKISPLATYEIEARVLSVQTYDHDRESYLSPLDFALGWGPMSDEDLLSHFTFVQDDRWCHFTSTSSPITHEVVTLHSANVHILPATDFVLNRASSVRAGDIIQAKGYLIEAKGVDGWTWRSSLTRADEGEQSCEIFWVESLTVVYGE